jgi:transposase
MSIVPKHRPPYPPELREQLVAMVRAGRSPEELARDYEPTAQSIRNWVAQADIDHGVVEGVTTDEREELRRLRRENRILREEREILKKAAAWFAEETNSTPSRRSSS